MSSLRSFLRALVAIGSAAVPFAGALEIHPADEAHGVALGDPGEYYACDEAHPRRLHVETARASERPACPVCLHRLQTGGVHLAEGSARQDLPALALLISGTAPATLSADRAAPGARAPPLLS
jgi:hypothetical protein